MTIIVTGNLEARTKVRDYCSRGKVIPSVVTTERNNDMITLILYNPLDSSVMNTVAMGTDAMLG